MAFLKRENLGNRSAWDESILKYRQYFKSVKAQFPPFLLEFRRYDMHDQEVVGLHRTKDSTTFELNHYILTFLGVVSFHATGPLVGDLWLFDEILLSQKPGYFVLNALFEENDISVEAKGISLLFRSENRFLVNDAGDTPKTKHKN
jgi:hypothetical protein